MKKLKTISLTLIITLLLSSTSFAHSGRTDSRGGHWNRKTGTYHYHNSGVKRSTTKSTSSSKSTTSSTLSSSSQVKNIQIRLNALGYDCGIPDGIMGSKTKASIKKFQKDKSLVADGIAGAQTLKKLGL